MAREYEKNLIVDAANRYGLDVSIALAQIQAESSFNPKAQSVVTKYGRAKGLAMFIDATAKQYGLTDPFDPVAAADAYGRLMRDLLKEFKGDYRMALAAYNAGPGNVRKYKGVPPFAETQNYVKKIMANAGKVSAPSSTGTGTSSTPGTTPSSSGFGLKEGLVIGFAVIAVVMTAR